MSLLATRALKSWYGDFQALFGIDFDLETGEVVAIIGANGAGKSTFLRSLTGLNAVERDSVQFDGGAIGGLAPYDIVKLGIALVPRASAGYHRSGGWRSTSWAERGACA